MSDNRLFVALRSGRALVGFSNTLAAEGLVEAVGRGFDFVWIDAQHGHHSVATAREAVREAQQINVAAVIRVPGHEYGLLGPFLDTGAEGIIVPMVGTAQEAAAIVRATRFPPRGQRSFGGRRVCDLYGSDYHRANEPVVIAQIESRSGLQNAAAIIAQEGIDLLLLGSVDLAIDMGLPKNEWSVRSPHMQGILRDLVRLAGEHGKAAGCVAPGPEALAAAIAAGVRFISAGDDTGHLHVGLRQWLGSADALRGRKAE
jgi:4-hydroxy-2-oxoheptanedioate aldolase